MAAWGVERSKAAGSRPAAELVDCAERRFPAGIILPGLKTIFGGATEAGGALAVFDSGSDADHVFGSSADVFGAKGARSGRSSRPASQSDRADPRVHRRTVGSGA